MGFDWEYILGDDNDVQQAYDNLLDTTERILEKNDTYITEMAAFMVKKCASPTFSVIVSLDSDQTGKTSPSQST